MEQEEDYENTLILSFYIEIQGAPRKEQSKASFVEHPVLSDLKVFNSSKWIT